MLAHQLAALIGLPAPGHLTDALQSHGRLFIDEQQFLVLLELEGHESGSFLDDEVFGVAFDIGESLKEGPAHERIQGLHGVELGLRRLGVISLKVEECLSECTLDNGHPI